MARLRMGFRGKNGHGEDDHRGGGGYRATPNENAKINWRWTEFNYKPFASYGWYEKRFPFFAVTSYHSAHVISKCSGVHLQFKIPFSIIRQAQMFPLFFFRLAPCASVTTVISLNRFVFDGKLSASDRSIRQEWRRQKICYVANVDMKLFCIFAVILYFRRTNLKRACIRTRKMDECALSMRISYGIPERIVCVTVVVVASSTALALPGRSCVRFWSLYHIIFGVTKALVDLASAPVRLENRKC